MRRDMAYRQCILYRKLLSAEQSLKKYGSINNLGSRRDPTTGRVGETGEMLPLLRSFKTVPTQNNVVVFCRP